MRKTTFDRIWKEDFAGDTNLLDDRPPRLIKTIWGIGYMWQGEG